MAEPSITSADEVLGLPPGARPRHIAIIMDGNGRWAQRQGLPRIEGHRRGVASVRRVTEECARLEIEQLTLYCLSSENWKRPPRELEFLMHLLEQPTRPSASALESSPQSAGTLTRRQREVLGLLGDGITCNDIASRLVISTATARNHIRAILRELQAH